MLCKINNIVSLPPTPVAGMEPSYYDLHDFDSTHPIVEVIYINIHFPKAIKLRNNLPLQITDSQSYI